MRSKIALVAATLALVSASEAHAKRGFSFKGFGSSAKPAPAAVTAPKPAAPVAAPAQAAAPKPPVATPAAAATPATQTAPRSSNSFIFVSTGGSRPANASGEKKDDTRQRNEQLPISDAVANAGDGAPAQIKPAGYKPPVLGGGTVASQSTSAPGFKQIN